MDGLTHGWKFNICKILNFETTILKLVQLIIYYFNFNCTLSLDTLYSNKKIYYNLPNSAFWGWLSMESQPQNPEFRKILKTFTHAHIVCLSEIFDISCKYFLWFYAPSAIWIVTYTISTQRSKTFFKYLSWVKPVNCLVLIQPRKTSEHDWKIDDWDLENCLKESCFSIYIIEPWHLISNNMALWQV